MRVEWYIIIGLIALIAILLLAIAAGRFLY